MKLQSRMVNIRLLFVLIQLILYVSFLTLDITGRSLTFSSYIKFTVIIFCFCFALISEGADKSISFCMKAALLFTVVSDFFLLLLDYYFYGVITFIIVQQLYNFRLSAANNRMKGDGKLSGIFRTFSLWLGIQLLIALIVLVVLHGLGIEADWLLLVSVFYFTCILTNTVRAVTATSADRKNQSSVLYAAGMLLFLLCDINVGLFNLSGFLAIPDNVYDIIYSFSSILMWTFYAPAQVLIALSISTKKMKKFM